MANAEKRSDDQQTEQRKASRSKTKRGGDKMGSSNELINKITNLKTKLKSAFGGKKKEKTPMKLSRSTLELRENTNTTLA